MVLIVFLSRRNGSSIRYSLPTTAHASYISHQLSDSQLFPSPLRTFFLASLLPLHSRVILVPPASSFHLLAVPIGGVYERPLQTSMSGLQF